MISTCRGIFAQRVLLWRWQSAMNQISKGNDVVGLEILQSLEAPNYIEIIIKVQIADCYFRLGRHNQAFEIYRQVEHLNFPARLAQDDVAYIIAYSKFYQNRILESQGEPKLLHDDSKIRTDLRKPNVAGRLRRHYLPCPV